MKKALLIGVGAFAIGTLGGKLLHKCVKKATENKPEDVKKEVEEKVAKALLIAGGLGAVYGIMATVDNINDRINVVNNNTELCFLTLILDSDSTNAEKLAMLRAAKDKFTSPKILAHVNEFIDKFTEVE
jgi:hypothetical protein